MVLITWDIIFSVIRLRTIKQFLEFAFYNKQNYLNSLIPKPNLKSFLWAVVSIEVIMATFLWAVFYSMKCGLDLGKYNLRKTFCFLNAELHSTNEADV